MIKFTWSFPQFDTIVSTKDNLTNVVKVIHWRLFAYDGDLNVSRYGSLTLPDPDKENFTPFEDLTQEWAIEIVSNDIDVEQMKEDMIKSLEKMKQPFVVPLPPPWNE